MEDTIEIRLTGNNGVKPGNIRSRDIAEVMSAIEDLVVAETLKKNPKLDRESIFVGLSQVQDKSIGLFFKASIAELIIPTFVFASSAMANERFEDLTPQALRSLKTISDFSKKYTCSAQFKVGNDLLAVVDPYTKIPQAPKIEGPTEITGKVVRVGGKTNPRVMVEMSDGTVVHCDVQKELAIELGGKLYKEAIFSGHAKWNARTYELEDFRITSIKDYPQRTPLEALEELRSLVGNEIDAIKDVNGFLAKLRSGE